jgi:isoleucyl-tRNA synthetase
MELKSTVNLPRTDFAQKANLPVSEPERLARWEAMDIYGKIRAARAGRPRYNLHDGPPYANGNIHLGHVLNKILKDFVVKMRTMQGFDAPYVPGWDCHGLPIEIQVDKKLEGRKAEMSVLDIRRAAREHAAHYVKVQADEFKRLGVFGDWAHPYLTMDYQYEADIVRVLGRFIAEGSVYKGPRPVYWCVSDRTALAEAEVEYQERESPSVYVGFPFVGDPGIIDPVLAGRDLTFVIWTTTPWTLPANLAIAFHANYDYVAVEPEGEATLYVVAEALLESVAAEVGWTSPRIVARFKGTHVERMAARHPLADRHSLFVLGEHVTLESGTGLVHTAPGHGHDDYVTGQKYGLEVYCPVDAAGRFDETVESFAGQKVFDANAGIVEALRDRGALLAAKSITHSYPHCWRCHKALIYRATPQWFIAMDHTGLRQRAVDALRGVEFVPGWAQERMVRTIEGRPDWCISRQRAWGVPITVFTCKSCDKTLSTPAVIEHVACVFEREGADAWFARPAAELLPEGTICECGGADFEKEADILDVWLDSGSSSLAVCERRDMGWPTDMYLEGNDQFRGWFNSSLIVALEARNAAPYRTVLVHGMTVDDKGEKLSKSKGNAPDLAALIRANGTELLRLWVSSVNYREEVPWSSEYLKRLSEAYRKIRNTARYALGNLDGFDPTADRVPYTELLEFDRWALGALDRLVRECRQAYEAYEFHVVYHAIYNFCTVELSSIYFDVLKDRLYTHAPKSVGRRSAQTVLFEIIHRLTRLIAPILVFTAEEIWEQLPGERLESVHLAEFPTPVAEWSDERLAAKWARLLEVRAIAQKGLEEQRAAREIGSSLEAAVVVRAPVELAGLLEHYREAFEDLLIVSEVEVQRSEGEGVEVEVRRAAGAKCERCWHYRPSVGQDATFPTVCDRCGLHLREGWPELATA